jgi:hypothetical protein
LLVVEDVVEESGLAGSQVTGEERYRYRFHACKFTKKRIFRQIGGSVCSKMDYQIWQKSLKNGKLLIFVKISCRKTYFLLKF